MCHVLFCDVLCCCVCLVVCSVGMFHVRLVSCMCVGVVLCVGCSMCAGCAVQLGVLVCVFTFVYPVIVCVYFV